MTKKELNSFEKHALDLEQLDEWCKKNIEKYKNETGEIVFDGEPNEQFNNLVDCYDRFLDTKNKAQSRAPVKIQDIVADEDAIQAALKTFHAINEKIQKQIENGVDLSKNDITLLVEMMKVFNGIG